MIYDITAHPTKYAGTMFRSRLEARWAAFFDLARIKWVYEPIDLDGWSPDFLLLAGSHNRTEVLAEVKPVSIADEHHRTHADVFAKAIRHSRKAWVLLLGFAPTLQFAETEGIGILLDPPAHEKRKWISVRKDLTVDDWQYLWRAAGNEVQWHL